MEIRLIEKHENRLLKKCRQIAHENYLDNLVLIGDLHPPCINLARIYGVFTEQKEMVSFFIVFVGFHMPSIVLPVKLERRIFVKIMEFLREILPESFLILSLELKEEDLTEFFRIGSVAVDYCMTIHAQDNPKEILSPLLKKATPEDVNRIDEFYQAIGSGPWHPKQLESGFYHFIEKDDQIIACGGTHFETPRLAQLGNIFVLEEFRGQKYGEIITTALTRAVLTKKEISTLFVRVENKIAQNLYKKLGYKMYKTANLIYCEK
jgi:ribosomal protein S18 acetylase RimI-like enzyme